MRWIALAGGLLLAGPAHGAVNVGQILVRHGEAVAVSEIVQAHLERGPEEKALPIVLVLEARRGWVLVSGQPNDRADERLAQKLSAGLSTRVLWLEVLGSSLSWRGARFEAGEEKERRVHPEQGWGGKKIEGSMPVYRDVEQDAWRWLRRHKVPVRLRFVGQSDLSRVQKGGTVATAISLLTRDDGVEAVQNEIRVQLPGRKKTAPTPVVTFVPVSESPEGLGVDLITLTGEAGAKSVAALARVFRQIEKRYHAGQKAHFCHLVPDAYRVVVYTELARRKSRCKSIYVKLLTRALEDAARPKNARPPPRVPRHPRRSP